MTRRHPAPAAAAALAASLAGPLALLIGVAAFPQALRPAAAQPARPALPSPPKVLYDPDQATCRPDHLEARYREQLRPWADQSEAVQARLRLLQAEMLRGTLRRCVKRGLLSPVDATALEQRLSLPPESPNAGAQPSGVRP